MNALQAFRLLAPLCALGIVVAPAALADDAPPAPPVSLAAMRLTLDEAIARALQRNPRIKVSDFGRGIGRANVLTQYGHFDPSINFRRTHSESESGIDPNGSGQPVQLSIYDDYSLTLDGIAPWGATYQIGGSSQNQRVSYNNFTNQFVTFGGVSVTQPLLRGFGFGANLANLHIAKADRSISDWQFKQTVIDTVTNVIIAYNDLAEAHENLRIATRSRDLAAQLVKDNERRNRIGSISDADVTQARARAAIRDETILFSQRDVKTTENQLRALIGDRDIAPDGGDIIIDPLHAGATVTPNGAADLHQALETRPDYQQAKLGIVKQNANRSLAANQILPRLDFVGSYGYNGISQNFATSREIVRDRDHRAYSAGFVVSMPLTFSEGRGRLRAAKLAVHQSEADLDRLEQDIAVSVANSIGVLETAGQRVVATQGAYELAQQALDAEEKKFKAGASSTFLVLQLQEELATVEARRVHAIADQNRAVASYNRELGTTLAAHHLKAD